MDNTKNMRSDIQEDDQLASPLKDREAEINAGLVNEKIRDTSRSDKFWKEFIKEFTDDQCSINARFRIDVMLNSLETELAAMTAERDALRAAQAKSLNSFSELKERAERAEAACSEKDEAITHCLSDYNHEWPDERGDVKTQSHRLRVLDVLKQALRTTCGNGYAPPGVVRQLVASAKAGLHVITHHGKYGCAVCEAASTAHKAALDAARPYLEKTV